MENVFLIYMFARRPRMGKQTMGQNYEEFAKRQRKRAGKFA